ncbi:MAG: ankyrin repeat domain-containing protein [Desulfobacula sp.]|nr:ankyrin repeat domain-containing protein [Desulfobacula sp.]
MNKRIFKRSIGYFGFLLMLTIVFSSQTFAKDIKGRVSSTKGDAITIELKGKFIPSIGDSVALYLEHEVLGEMSIGIWRVTKVDYPNVHATKVDATGDAKVGVKAVIQTAVPKPAISKKGTKKIARPDPVKGAVDESLIVAAENGSLSDIKIAIQKGANLNAARDTGSFALAVAAVDGHADIVEALLNKGATPDLEDAKGRTALGLAAFKGKDDIIRILVKNKTDINYKNHAQNGPFPGATPLCMAAKRKQFKTIKLPLSLGADPQIEDKFGRNALGYAIISRDLDIINVFLNFGVSLDSSVLTGLSPLHIAAEWSRGWQIFAYLIGAGADVNAGIKKTAVMPQDIHGATPLFFMAGQVSEVETILLMLLAGADSSIKTVQGKTALDEIRRRKEKLIKEGRGTDDNFLKDSIRIEKILKDPVWGKKEAEKFFQEELADAVDDNDINSLMALDAIGFDLGHALKNQQPLLGEAIAEGRYKMARLLIKYGANPVVQDEDGRTPFLASVYKGQIEFVKLFFEKGALPNDLPWGVPFGTLQLAYEYAKENQMKIIEYLLSIGADPNWRNKEGDTPLHIAAKKGDEQFFKLLIDNGANPRLQNQDKKRAIDLVPSSKKQVLNRIQNKVWPPTSIIVRTIELLETTLLKAENSRDWALYKKTADQLIEQGDPKGFWAMGMVYSKGLGVDIDHKKAFDYFRQGSNIEIGDRYLYYYLGLYHETGLGGIKKNYKKAALWYEKAIKKGSIEAYYRLGKMTLQGLGVKKDPYRAFVLITSSAVQGSGYAEAIHWLGYLYENGIGTSKNTRIAKTVYKAAEKQGFRKEKTFEKKADKNTKEIKKLLGQAYQKLRKGKDETSLSYIQDYTHQDNPTAQYYLALVYYYGRGKIDKNYKIALNWFLKAGTHGHAKAQDKIGYMYEMGYGVKRSDAIAAKWYGKAAKNGYKFSQNTLGLFYKNGWGVTKNYPEAMKWFQKAADQGYAEAQYNMGLMYDHGQGILENDALAVKWYKKTADQGHHKAQSNLGFMYEHGEGVPKDIAVALRLYKKAADQGYDLAQNNLGLMYGLGRGVSKNESVAVEWFRKAADKGLADAQRNLGVMYDLGLGISEDDVIAVKWFRKAANQGHAEAQNNLGLMFEKGNGVKKSISTAKKWYSKSAVQGNKNAQKNLERLK